MEEDLLFTRHQAQALQELRKRLAAVWSDAAAHEINLRYLDPHEDENKAMLECCGDQFELTGLAAQQVNETEHAVRAVELLCTDVHELLDECEKDLALCFQYFEQYAHASASANTLIIESDDLIRQAVMVCEGVPKQ